MKLTAQLKSWLIAEKLVAADETNDEVYVKAVTDAIVAGTLSATKLVELQTDEKAKEANQVLSMLRDISAGVAKNANDIAEAKAVKAEPAPVAPAAVVEEAQRGGDVTIPLLPDSVKAAMGGAEPLSGDKKELSIRLKGVEEGFERTKTPLKYPTHTQLGTRHPKAGQIVTEGDRIVYESNELDKAICGMWFKYQLQSSTGGRGVPPQLRINDQDKALFEYALHECKWGGKINSTGEDNGIEINNSRLKAIAPILDDVASGGLEAAPIAFDDAIITFPLLYGELFPKVNLVNITRGRRIEGVSVQNVSLTWGGVDNVAIPLEDTAAFIAAFDTFIHVVEGSIEVGLDFLSDAAVDIGPIITDGYGRQLLTQLDNVIATGTGSGQPQGIMLAAGTTSVAQNGVTATVGGYEGLLFGVAKEYKNGHPTNSVCFCANETTYSRARGIAVGATDERRVFGMQHEDYTMFGRPFGINGSMTNAQIFFGVLPRYRMYRRLGMTMRSSTEGTTLIRRNMLLISSRSRWGGQIEDPGAFAVTTDALA